MMITNYSHPYHRPHQVTTGALIRRPARDISSPIPPSHPFASPDLRILRAWIEAEQAGSDARAVMAAVETAIERILGGRDSATDVWELLPAWIRPYFGCGTEGQGLKRLLGRWAKDGSFVAADVPERYRLTEDECAVYGWFLRGWRVWEIQRELTSKKRRHDRELWVPMETVERHLSRAATKVRGMFGISVV